MESYVLLARELLEDMLKADAFSPRWDQKWTYGKLREALEELEKLESGKGMTAYETEQLKVLRGLSSAVRLLSQLDPSRGESSPVDQIPVQSGPDIAEALDPNASASSNPSLESMLCTRCVPPHHSNIPHTRSDPA